MCRAMLLLGHRGSFVILLTSVPAATARSHLPVALELMGLFPNATCLDAGIGVLGRKIPGFVLPLLLPLATGSVPVPALLQPGVPSPFNLQAVCPKLYPPRWLRRGNHQLTSSPEPDECQRWIPQDTLALETLPSHEQPSSPHPGAHSCSPPSLRVISTRTKLSQGPSGKLIVQIKPTQLHFAVAYQQTSSTGCKSVAVGGISSLLLAMTATGTLYLRL